MISNAVEAMVSGGDQLLTSGREPPKLIISTFQKNDCFSIRIVDNGPGIPEDLIGSIFYPMISGRAEGTGLGLSIAHSIINQHKGMIECDSKPGHTRFAIYIPVAPNARGKRKLAETQDR